jgi:subtilisin family serine protease
MLKNQIASHMNQIVSHMTGRTCCARPVPVFALVSAAALILAACGGGGVIPTHKVKVETAEVRDTAYDIRYELTPEVPSYALAAIGADRFGGVGFAKGQGVSVAVIDSEIDDGHPDLSPAFNRDEKGNAIGRNVVESHNDTRPVAHRIRTPRSDIIETGSAEDRRLLRQKLDTVLAQSISHGTHVSGIIAARDNGFGVAGVAPQARLVPVTLFRDRQFVQYERYGLSGLNDRDLPDWNRRVAASVNYAASRNVFAINNSWGFHWFAHEIRSSDNKAPGPYYFRLPNFFLQTDPVARTDLHSQIFDAGAISALESAVSNGAVVVFAAGNDGWNSETGEHKVFSTSLIDPVTKECRSWVDYRDEKHLDYIRVVPRRISFDGGRAGSVLVPANIPSLESSYFVTNDRLKGSWLAVVNVDKRNIIHWSSNGCGIARDYCLAAPGTNVRSTFVRGDKDDVKDQDGVVETKKPTGDVNLNENDCYGTYTGTSMAAPMVSGALAVLKSNAPNLTARQAVKILLCAAIDLDKSPNRPAKSIEECAQKGVEATHDNGWAPSEVYGHGLVSLVRALLPIGQQRTAGGHGRPVADIASTRIAFSSAFGNAAPSATHHFGGLDSYGRSIATVRPFRAG